jgi:IclR family transcriptional regulator, acetate operon repressor
VNEKPRKTGEEVAVLVKAMSLLVTLAEGSQTVVQLSKTTGVSKPGVYRILKTLDTGGFVVRDPERKEFSLGPALMGLGRATNNSSGLIRTVRPTLREVHEKFNETVNLGVLNHGRIIYLDTIESRQRLRVTVPITMQDNVHATALGKAIISAMPTEVALGILNEAELLQRTKNTILTLEELLEATQRAKKLGYAIDNEEDEIGFRCVAAPILNSQNFPIAAISVTAPTSRLSLEDFSEIGEHLKTLAAGLKKNFPN